MNMFVVVVVCCLLFKIKPTKKKPTEPEGLTLAVINISCSSPQTSYFAAKLT